MPKFPLSWASGTKHAASFRFLGVPADCRTRARGLKVHGIGDKGDLSSGPPCNLRLLPLALVESEVPGFIMRAAAKPFGGLKGKSKRKRRASPVGKRHPWFAAFGFP